MGYKLAGFDVIGANEIDPEMAWHYQKNHKPKLYFLEDIRTFKKRDDLPPELYDLDVLDGSPPCSSFSMSGNREKDWGKNKVFREGQSEQTLDDLFFDFIDLAGKLKPKVVVAENVKGMLVGNAKGYVKEIIKRFKEVGYDVQLFLLNAATMGVPQRRERVFFVCRRLDLGLEKLNLVFNHQPITVEQAFQAIADINYPGRDKSSSSLVNYWYLSKPGESFAKYHPKGSAFSQIKIARNAPSHTLTANHDADAWHYDSPRSLSRPESCIIGSYPLDYVFKEDKISHYLVGMSVLR
jgi:DNA (cytosine-5)-methyltransferase 1